MYKTEAARCKEVDKVDIEKKRVSLKIKSNSDPIKNSIISFISWI